MNELKINGFSAVAEEELETTNGGFVITSAFIGACVVWGINAGLLAFGISQAYN